MHLKTFPSKWPKQMAFHFGARSSTSWRSPFFLSTSWPSSQEGRAAWQAHMGQLWTGNQASPTGTPPCGCQSPCRGVHEAMMFSPYPLPSDSLQLFGCVSEAAQACWTRLIVLHPTCTSHRNSIFVRSPFRSLLLGPCQHTSHYSASPSSWGCNNLGFFPVTGV